jgi:hypothetical protein
MYVSTPIRLSELVAQLEALIAEHGDLQVLGTDGADVGLDIEPYLFDIDGDYAMLDLIAIGGHAPD